MCYCFTRQKHTSQYQLKKPISLRPHAVKTAIHLQSTKINKNPFVTQRVFLHTLFLEYTTETGGNKCKAVFYTYKQIGMQSLELFWPCSILAKNLGDVLARGLSNTLHILRKLDLARALIRCHKPEGSWALGTRMSGPLKFLDEDFNFL